MNTKWFQKCFLFAVCSVDNEVFSVRPFTCHWRAG